MQSWICWRMKTWGASKIPMLPDIGSSRERGKAVAHKKKTMTGNRGLNHYRYSPVGALACVLDDPGSWCVGVGAQIHPGRCGHCHHLSHPQQRTLVPTVWLMAGMCGMGLPHATSSNSPAPTENRVKCPPSKFGLYWRVAVTVLAWCPQHFFSLSTPQAPSLFLLSVSTWLPWRPHHKPEKDEIAHCDKLNSI